jgi:hypothetical protein
VFTDVSDALLERRARFGADAILFACGPLADHGRRRAILGADLRGYPAVLHDWTRVRGEDGAIFARPSRGDSVIGVAIPVTEEQLRTLDRSATFAHFVRAIAVVDIDGLLTGSFVYTRRGRGEKI